VIHSARGNFTHTITLSRLARRARAGIATPFCPRPEYVRSMSIKIQFRLVSVESDISSICASSLAVTFDMAAAPPPQASRTILRHTFEDLLRKNTSGVFIRTDITLCCDQMRALCALGKLLPSTDHYPNCLFYGGHRALNGQCILNTPIKTASDPRNRKKFETREFVQFETVAHYFESLLPIRDELLKLPANRQEQQFAQLRHSIYTAIALDAIQVKGKVCQTNHRLLC
jgi:hypothetical protein